MIPFPQYIRLTLITSSFFLVISMAMWLFFPSFRPISGGYFLGTLVSIINGGILAAKTVKISDYALDRSKKLQGTGVLQRFLLAGFIGYASVRYPAIIHWSGVIPGLMTVTVFSLLIAIGYHYAHRKG